MKIKWGALVVDGRGKIGGQVASKNRSGAYMRNKVTPVNPATSYQVDVRATLGSLAANWRGLTQAQRDSWNSAVADFKKTDIFGDIQNPSGFNLYIRLNANLAAINVAPISAPPQPTSVSVFTSVQSLSVDPTPTVSTTVVPTTLPATESLIIRATPPVSAGKSFVKSEFRQIAVLTSITAGAIDVSTAWEAKFGDTLPAGSKIFVEFVHVNETTGQSSQAQQAFGISEI